MVSLERLSKKGKAFFLAYDQGIEHGPTDFDNISVNPENIIRLAKDGPFTGVIFQKGIAEKYKSEIKKTGVSLIVKLNGKTKLVNGEPFSRQICSVDEAVRLGAVAVGFTIYIGSVFEGEMLREFGKIQEEAHKKNLPVVVWIYPRGKSIAGKSKEELMAYASRVGLEIGADIVKVRGVGSERDLKWAIDSAGRTKVVFAGGLKMAEAKFLKGLKTSVSAGCFGFAIGRNLWQSKNPLELANKIRDILWK